MKIRQADFKLRTILLKHYYSLVKPGIIYGNVVTILAGFLLAAGGRIDLRLLVATVFGVSFVMAAGCVFNNYIDRDIDALMERTKSRVLVSGLIPPRHALVYGGVLGVLGFSLLFFFTNMLAVFIAAVGAFFYVIVYSMWGKRQTVYGTLIGSVSGAVPPVAGYCAVTGYFDLGALLLFLILCVWQMPHSYAIAIYRLGDYQAAGVPVLPVVKGIAHTKVHIRLYIIVFAALATLLFAVGYVGTLYFSIIIPLVVGWLYLSLKKVNGSEERQWARRMFLFSILVLMIFSLLVSFGPANTPSIF